MGRRLVAALKADGHSVRVLDIPRADFSCVQGLGAKVLEGSVVDGESVQVALGASRVVFHLAAPDPAIRDGPFIRKMVVAGAEVLMEEAEDARVEHVVAASTTGVYPRTQGLHSEDVPPRPGNRLERAKLDMERALERGARAGGIGVTVLRLANVYGAGDGGIVDVMASQVMGGEPVVMPDHGFVSTVHVDDVVTAARRLADGSRTGGGEGSFRVLNCVDDRAHTPRELLDVLARVLGSPAPVLRRPGLLGATRGSWARRGDGVRLVERGRYPNSAIRALLPGWPRRGTLEEGLPGELAED